MKRTTVFLLCVLILLGCTNVHYEWPFHKMRRIEQLSFSSFKNVFIQERGPGYVVFIDSLCLGIVKYQSGECHVPIHDKYLGKGDPEIDEMASRQMKFGTPGTEEYLYLKRIMELVSDLKLYSMSVDNDTEVHLQWYDKLCPILKWWVVIPGEKGSSARMTDYHKYSANLYYQLDML